MSQTAYQNIHLLLPKDKFLLLKKKSKAEKKSVSELIRQAIERVYGGPTHNKRIEAFRRIAARSDLQMDDWPKVKEELLHRYDKAP